MKAEMLIATLEQGGVRLRVEGDRLKLEAPADRMPSEETITGLRENKAAVLEYLRVRQRPRAIQFSSFPTPIERKTEKLEYQPDANGPVRSNGAVPCGSPACAGCYDVGDGRRIHPPKCGGDYLRWLERWEAKGKLQ
jgi:hypothetical protein